MFLFIIAFRLLKGSSLFTHLWFLSSGIELWHMLFTLNKYLLVERRIISSSAWIIFAISTEVWTLTFLRALIRQVYGGTAELFPRAGENCSGITCGPAFGVWNFGLCVDQQWLVWLWMECCSPKRVHQGLPLPGPSLLSMCRITGLTSEHLSSPKLMFHGYRMTVLARLGSLSWIHFCQYQIAVMIIPSQFSTTVPIWNILSQSLYNVHWYMWDHLSQFLFQKTGWHSMRVSRKYLQYLIANNQRDRSNLAHLFYCFWFLFLKIFVERSQATWRRIQLIPKEHLGSACRLIIIRI